MYSRIRHSAAAGVCCRGPALTCVRACGGELAVLGGIIRRLPSACRPVTTFLLAAEPCRDSGRHRALRRYSAGWRTAGISGTLARRRVLAPYGAWEGTRGAHPFLGCACPAGRACPGFSRLLRRRQRHLPACRAIRCADL